MAPVAEDHLELQGEPGCDRVESQRRRRLMPPRLELPIAVEHGGCEVEGNVPRQQPVLLSQ